MAETVQQLLAGLQLLGQLQPFTITLAKGMSMPAASWPGGITVGHAVVLAGLPPPAPRTILDLYQVRRGGAGLPVYSVPVFAVTRSSPMLAFVCVVTWCVAHPGPPAVCMRCWCVVHPGAPWTPCGVHAVFVTGRLQGCGSVVQRVPSPVPQVIDSIVAGLPGIGFRDLWLRCGQGSLDVAGLHGLGIRA